MKHQFVKCSLPNCDEKVGYHNRKGNVSSGYRYSWKTMCEKHRGSQKHITDKWKLDTGCQNTPFNKRYPFPCVTGAILDPGILQVNHIDGNNLNRHSSNIEVLCNACHVQATKLGKHHLQKYPRFPVFGNTALFDGF